MSSSPTLLTYVTSIAKVIFVTAAYWLVGMLPEQNHGMKGEAWARIHAYRWAAWHFRKYLGYTDDHFGRTWLAWCYLQLGMLDTARDHYRVAYARRKHPETACALAQVELWIGNVAAARALVADVGPRRDELRPEFQVVLTDLESQLSNAPVEAIPAQNYVVSDADIASVIERERHRKPRPLVSALKSAYAAFVVTFFVINTFVLLSSRNVTPTDVITLVWVSLIMGVVFCVGLLLVHAPVLALTLAHFGNRLKIMPASLLGVVLIAVPVGVYAVVFADSEVSPTAIWAQLSTGQFIGLLLPTVFGSALFASAFVRATSL